MPFASGDSQQVFTLLNASQHLLRRAQTQTVYPQRFSRKRPHHGQRALAQPCTPLDEMGVQGQYTSLHRQRMDGTSLGCLHGAEGLSGREKDEQLTKLMMLVMALILGQSL